MKDKRASELQIIAPLLPRGASTPSECGPYATRGLGGGALSAMSSARVALWLQQGARKDWPHTGINIHKHRGYIEVGSF